MIVRFNLNTELSVIHVHLRQSIKCFLSPEQETEKLVIFLLGIVSHQVADISWHSLGIDQGFIRTMSKASNL